MHYTADSKTHCIVDHIANNILRTIQYCIADHATRCFTDYKTNCIPYHTIRCRPTADHATPWVADVGACNLTVVLQLDPTTRFVTEHTTRCIADYTTRCIAHSQSHCIADHTTHVLAIIQVGVQHAHNMLYCN